MQGAGGGRRAQRSARAIAELFMQIGRLVHGDADAANLNAAQWAELRFVAEANTSVEKIGGFARLYRITPSSASQTIPSLSKRALVEKTQARDARVRTLGLTPGGRRLLSQDPIDRLTRGLLTLSERELYDLALLLGRVIRATVTE